MGIKKEITVIVVIGMSVCFLSVEGTSEFPICTESHAQFFPAVYEDIVVWEDNRNGNWDIYGYNLTTCEEFQITDDLRDQKHPEIFKNIVIWEVEEEEYREYLYGYNLLTQEEFVIAKSGEINSSAIYGDIVVWEQRSEICGYNLLTQEEFVITEDSLQRWPAIYGDIVVWENMWRDKDPIRGFNLFTNQEIQVDTRNPFVILTPSQHEPAIYGDIVIWKEEEDDNIYGCNLLTGRRFAIATARARAYDKPGSVIPEGSRRPAIYGDIVVWVDCRNGNEDIYGFNLSTKEEFQITTSQGRERSPALYNTTVVWEDNRNGNMDIYGCHLTPPFAITEGASRVKLLVYDAIWTLFVGGLIAFILFSVGLDILKVKKFNDTSKEMRNSKTVPQDFKRNDSTTSAQFIYAILWGFFGLCYIKIEFPFMLGFLAVALSAHLLFNSLCNRKVPYLRITDDKIMIFPSKIWRPKIISWNTVSNIDFHLKNKIELMLSNGKKVKIKMSSLSVDDDVQVIQKLKQVQEQHFEGVHSRAETYPSQ